MLLNSRDSKYLRTFILNDINFGFLMRPLINNMFSVFQLKNYHFFIPWYKIPLNSNVNYFITGKKLALYIYRFTTFSCKFNIFK